MHPTDSVNPSRLGQRWATWWPWLALCVWLLALATIRPLALPDEGRYADVARWMLNSGDWLAPRLDGMPFFHKPPLLHWLQATSFRVFGLHPWSARLVPALHALLMVAATYAATARLGTPALAQRAALILGTSLGILVGGQYVNHDMMVATWVSVAIWCFAVALQHTPRPHAQLTRLGFVACALGVLSKGLIGLALPGLVLVVWVLWTRQLQRVWRLPWLTGVLVFCAVALPWFVLAQHTYPGLFDYMFGNQQLARYTASGFNNVRPWWFYGVALALLMSPWTWVLPWTLYAHFSGHASAQPESPPPPDLPTPLRTLCWVWVVAITVFFSLPASKLVGYLLPVIPPVAVLLAHAWRPEGGPRARWLFRATAIAGAALGLVLTLVAGEYTQKKSAQDVAAALACRAGPTDELLAVDGYPYDLPFYANWPRAIRVVQDWEHVRATAGDDWRRELFESANFDAQAALALQPLEALTTAAQTPHTWLLAPTELDPADPLLAGWRAEFTGKHWSLWASVPSATESPQAAQHKGLPGCNNQSGQQRHD